MSNLQNNSSTERTPLNVLLIEDSEMDAFITTREIEHGGFDVQIRVVETASELHDALANKTWDIIISDHSMPHFSATEALSIVKSKELDVPFVILSGAIGEQTAVEAIKNGASNYIMKDKISLLVPTIRRELREANIRREKIEAQNALKENAERYMRLLEFLPESVVVLAQSCIKFANPAAKTLLRAQNKFELLDKQFTDFFSENIREEATLVLDAIISHDERLQNRELQIKRFDNTSIDIELSAVKITWANDAACLVLFKDITERKHAEAEIRQYQDQLRNLASALEIAEEHERRRIATELHDDVAQILATLKFKVSELEAVIKLDNCSTTLTEMRKSIDQVIRFIRSLTVDLSPPVLYELGFIPALGWLCEKARKQYSFVVDFTDDGLGKPMKPEYAIMLFKSVNELLHNVSKYAHASRVRVETTRTGNMVKIIIADDGIGFDIHNTGRANATGGFGLFSIRERLRFIGGEFGIRSQQGNGTIVTIIAPLEEQT